MDFLKTSLTIIRNLKKVLAGRLLFYKFDDLELTTKVRDSSNNDYHGKYIGVRPLSNVWSGESIVLDGDYVEVPAAPFNFCKNFTIRCWVKTDSPLFTIFSGKRNGQPALEITNKRVTIDGVSITYTT